MTDQALCRKISSSKYTSTDEIVGYWEILNSSGRGFLRDELLYCSVYGKSMVYDK